MTGSNTAYMRWALARAYAFLHLPRSVYRRRPSALVNEYSRDERIHRENK